MSSKTTCFSFVVFWVCTLVSGCLFVCVVSCVRVFILFRQGASFSSWASDLLDGFEDRRELKGVLYTSLHNRFARLFLRLELSVIPVGASKALLIPRGSMHSMESCSNKLNFLLTAGYAQTLLGYPANKQARGSSAPR